MPHLSIGDVSLNVIEKGSGQPLLLVHGFPLDHSMWQEQIADLSASYHIIAPDLRGFGGSDVTRGVVTMEMLADDLAKLLDALSVTQGVALCGLSMGGYIAWQFWQRHRSKLSHLILCDTRVIADAEEVARGRLQLAERVLAQGPTAVADSMLPRLFAKSTAQQRPELVDAIRQVMLANPPEGIAAALRGMAQRKDFSAIVSQIAVPALVLCGEHDEISRVEEMRGFAATMPNARFEVIPNAGHMAPLENPAAVNTLIRDFLGK